jgi:hypothetical protein
MLVVFPYRIATAKILEKERNLNKFPAYSDMLKVRMIGDELG